MNLMRIPRATIVALAISLGGTLLARAIGFPIDPVLFAVLGAIGGATFAAGTGGGTRREA